MQACWAIRSIVKSRITKSAWDRMARRRARFACGNPTRMAPAEELSLPITIGLAAPLTVGLEKLHSDQRFAILAQVAPIDAATCELRLVMAMDYAHDVPEENFVHFQDQVTAQDKVVVESQHPELLPLDLQAGTAPALGSHGDCLSQMAAEDRTALACVIAAA